MWVRRRGDRERLIKRMVALMAQGQRLCAVALDGHVISIERVADTGEPVFYRQVIRAGPERARTDYIAAQDAAASFIRLVGPDRGWSVVREPHSGSSGRSSITARMRQPVSDRVRRPPDH